MKKLKRWLTSPKATIILFALSVFLLLFSVIGAVRAALRYKSASYGARIQQCCIGVSLMEQCQNDTTTRVAASRDHDHDSKKRNLGDKWLGNEMGVLLGSVEDNKEENSRFLGTDPAVYAGKEYPETICVKNSGEIDEYVRLTIYRYWLNPKGQKVFGSGAGPSPKLIKLNWVNSDVWLHDEKASTEEREVFYYKNLLKKDAVSDPICDKLTIDSEIERWVTQTKTDNGKGGTKIVTSYDYDGWKFCLEAQVDAVQNHNIVDAAKSAWGVDLTVSNGQILLKKN